MDLSSGVLSQLSARYTDLDHWISVDDRWLNCWTIMVVIGVALELLVIAHDYQSDLGEFKRGIVRPPDRPSKRRLLFELLGAGLVVVGVLGEFFVTRAIGENEAAMRVISREQVSIADAKLAEVQQENTRLRRAVGPRELSGAQKEQLGEIARKYPGLTIDLFVVDPNDSPNGTEARRFAWNIGAALEPYMDATVFIGSGCAQWSITGGIVESVQDMSRDRLAAGEIMNALTSEDKRAFVPLVPAVQAPPCQIFSVATPDGKPSTKQHKQGWSKTAIIIGTRPPPLVE